MEATAKNQEIYKTEALLQFALMHGDEEQAAVLREKLLRLTGLGSAGIGEPPSLSATSCQECKPVWNGAN